MINTTEEMKYDTETIGIISVVIMFSSFIIIFAWIWYHPLAIMWTILWFIWAGLGIRGMIHRNDMK